MEKLWTPSRDRVDKATITDFARVHGFAPSDYHALWRWTVERRDTFWRSLWDYAGVIGEPGDRVVLARFRRARGSRSFRTDRAQGAVRRGRLLVQRQSHPRAG